MNNLHKIITHDGTISLRSDKFNENFHSHIGAFKETADKFIIPSMLKRFKNKSLKVLDVCFGLGYNSALLFNELLGQKTNLEWFGLEIDKRPLIYALEDDRFLKLWDPKVIDILYSLQLKSLFKNKDFNCNLFIGDARKEIHRIPKEINFDLIFLDGFSPQKCPEIWSIEFLSKLKNKLFHDGYLITYSSSAAVRLTLKNQGLNIFNIKPGIYDKNLWSNGTLATLNKQNKNPYIIELSEKENEHLRTKASIPYRDKTGNLSSQEILEIRKKEQLISKLLDTNLWRDKWKMA